MMRSFFLAPFWDSNVLSMGCVVLFIDHVESCHIVNEHACWARSKSIKCCDDASKAFGDLLTSHRQVELSFS